mgnify:CR=1 FL=1
MDTFTSVVSQIIHYLHTLPMLAMVLWTLTHSCPQHHLVIMSSIDILRINPFAINPYPATGIVDTSMNYYSSMDVLGQSYFIATGGNYGFIKHVTLDIPTTLCYMNNTIHMEILPNITITPNTFSYDIVPWNITPTSPTFSSMAVSHSIRCVQY